MVQQQMAPGFVVQMQETCSECGGRGNKVKNVCPHCQGRKVMLEEKVLTADIEKGMPSDSEIRFERESEQSPGITPTHHTQGGSVRIQETGSAPRRPSGVCRAQGGHTTIRSQKGCWRGYASPQLPVAARRLVCQIPRGSAKIAVRGAKARRRVAVQMSVSHTELTVQVTPWSSWSSNQLLVYIHLPGRSSFRGARACPLSVSANISATVVSSHQRSELIRQGRLRLKVTNVASAETSG
jgi:hypothetical protein